MSYPFGPIETALVIGSDGRSEVLRQVLARTVPHVYSMPGNGGTPKERRRLFSLDDTLAKASMMVTAKGTKSDLCVISPEQPLVDNFAGVLRDNGFRCVGPPGKLAWLEGSKAAAVRFCIENAISIPDSAIFDDPDAAKAYVRTHGAPIVIKADGLAAGKGVTVAQTVEEALKAIRLMMEERFFGAAGERIVIQECVFGRECSFVVLSDGEHILQIRRARDYKCALDGDKGPNTGGMGSYAPVDDVSAEMELRVIDEIIMPVIRATGYDGVLYAGVMITADGPVLLEFNVRFGDPETQVQLAGLETDFAQMLWATTIPGGCAQIEPVWSDQYAVCVVCAAHGYPGPYEKGQLITGIRKAEEMGAIVYHAGTELDEEGRPRTDGGRVLSVTAQGDTLAEARELAYQAVAPIRFNGKPPQHRTDIGAE